MVGIQNAATRANADARLDAMSHGHTSRRGAVATDARIELQQRETVRGHCGETTHLIVGEQLQRAKQHQFGALVVLFLHVQSRVQRLVTGPDGADGREQIRVENTGGWESVFVFSRKQWEKTPLVCT